MQIEVSSRTTENFPRQLAKLRNQANRLQATAGNYHTDDLSEHLSSL